MRKKFSKNLNLNNKNLYYKIVTADSILKALLRTQSNKTQTSKYRYETLQIFGDKTYDSIIYLISQDLYELNFKQFSLFDRKHRIIISPKNINSLIQRLFYEYTYKNFHSYVSKRIHSCINNRSTKTATTQIRNDLKNLKPEESYYLKTDFKSFFNSIDSNILYSKLESQILDKKVLKYLKSFIFKSKNPKGIPFGNLLSQLFGNFYISELDFLLENLKYTRFADDIIIFGTKPKLLEYLKIIKEYCDKNLLKLSYARINNNCYFNFCGIKHFKSYFLLDSRHVKTKTNTYNHINDKNFSKNKIL